MMTNTIKTAAALIANELESICTAERLSDFAADDSGNESLMQHESLVRTRLGADYDASAWDAAMDIIRERH